VPHVVAAFTGVVSGIYIFKPLVDDGMTGSALEGQQNSNTVDGPGLTALDQSRAGDRNNQTVHRHTER